MSGTTESEQQLDKKQVPAKKHTGLRVGLAAAIGFLGSAGAVLTGKTILDEASKQKVGASEKQPGGKMPSEQAYEELVIPTSEPTPLPSATPTATKTPESTSTPTPAPTPTETPTPVPKEKPTSLTEKNFAEFVTPVSKEEFKKLTEAQPEAFAFPVGYSSGDLQITYTDQPSASPETTRGNYKKVEIIGSDFEVTASIDGEIQFRRNDPHNKEKINDVLITKKISTNTTIQVQMFLADSRIAPLATDGQIDKGTPLFRANGRVGMSIYTLQKLAQPIVIDKPDGGKTEILGYVTYLAPSIFENSGWISKDGKTVTTQN